MIFIHNTGLYPIRIGNSDKKPFHGIEVASGQVLSIDTSQIAMWHLKRDKKKKGVTRRWHKKKGKKK